MEKALAIQKEVMEILGTDEVYLPVVGWEGYYEVSNYGNVKSLDRTITDVKTRWGNTTTMIKKGIYLKKKTDKYGYYVVCLFKDKVRQYTTVHRLVAFAFLGNDDSLLQVNHIDANKSNNHPSNLEWVTPQQNIDHAIRLGLQNYAHGEKLPQTKLKQEEVIEIKKLLKLGKMSQRAIARKFNIGSNAVWHIAHGETWKKV